MVTYDVQSHQRGRGLSSSRIPSHSWAVVSTPVGPSILRSDMVALVVFEGEPREALECLLVAGPERVDHAGEEQDGEVDRAALLGEAGDRLVLLDAGHLWFS